MKEFIYMDNVVRSQLLQDFERYMAVFYASYKRFTLEEFSEFSSTILNYYVGNKVVLLEEKKNAAYYLCTLYNKGIGNRISEEHLQVICELISDDNNVDFSVIKRLFG